jgi:hypothetical protein
MIHKCLTEHAWRPLKRENKISRVRVTLILYILTVQGTFQSVCLSTFSVRSSVRLTDCPSVRPTDRPSVLPTDRPSVCSSVCPCVCLPVRKSVRSSLCRSSVRPFIRTSFYLYTYVDSVRGTDNRTPVSYYENK